MGPMMRRRGACVPERLRGAVEWRRRKGVREMLTGDELAAIKARLATLPSIADAQAMHCLLAEVERLLAGESSCLDAWEAAHEKLRAENEHLRRRLGAHEEPT